MENSTQSAHVSGRQYRPSPLSASSVSSLKQLVAKLATALEPKTLSLVFPPVGITSPDSNETPAEPDPVFLQVLRALTTEVMFPHETV